MPDLFDPVKIGSVELKNRIVMAPLTRSRAAAGFVPGLLAPLYYAQRASAGLIISEATQIMQQGQGYFDTPGIYNDAQVAGWRKVTEAVHAKDGKIFLQLWHVGRISHSSFQPGGALPVAPSALAASGEVRNASGEKVPYETPHALTMDEIGEIIAQYGKAAELAKQAGFDGVEVHGANSYLIDQFLRDGVNLRTDEYGGSVQNRARFLLEATAAVVDVWGGDRVGVRLSPRAETENLKDSDPVQTFGYAADALNRFSLAYLHTREPHVTDGTDVTPRLRGIFHGPLIINQQFTQETAAQAIESGAADMVAFGVPYIANPDLVERFKANAPLNEPDKATFYGGGERGYTDYPTL